MTNDFRTDIGIVKKFFVCGICCFFSLNVFSLQTPALLQGIWEGADRLLYFSPQAESANAESTPLAVVLKTYYGWYYDRAAEPQSFGEAEPRFRSVPTHPEAEHISVTYEPIYTGAAEADLTTSGAWELVIDYGRREVVRIPIAVIDGKLYLNFVIRGRGYAHTSFQTDSEQTVFPPDLFGYWEGVSPHTGIRIAPAPTAENIASYYFTEQALYVLRYWKKDIEYQPEADAVFTDHEKEFSVPKHISSGGAVYTSTTGRSRKIRNSDRTVVWRDNYTLDSSGTICAFGAPYLTKRAESTAAELFQIVAAANSRRKPDPPPLFPPHDANWYWDDIHRLEAGNPLIRAVRERQEAFARGELTE